MAESLSSWYFRRQSSVHDEEQAVGSAEIPPPVPPMPMHMRTVSIPVRDTESVTSNNRSSWADTILSYTAWERFRGLDRKKVGWVESLKAILFHSWLNTWLVFVPIAWALHFANVSHPARFAVSFLAIIPLNKLLEFGGEQLSLYCGKRLGDLVVITLNNTVEAVLAIILLARCDLRLLQSTIIGVIILHLLLVPGTTFLTGGARILEQNLDRHFTQMNHTLLTIGVLALLLPTSFFAALDRGAFAQPDAQPVVFDILRNSFLNISRGLAVIILIVYICSRIFLHSTPTKGDQETLKDFAIKGKASTEGEPEMNTWVTIIMLVVLVILTSVTAAFLVESIEEVRATFKIEQEWFGLILLPLVTFSGDAILATVYYVRFLLKNYLGEPEPPSTVAETRSIDSSVQFIIFWLPFLIILGWWSGKPMMLLFDLFELGILLGACFLVNYVTADSKTNWQEGLILIAFYLMIAITAWFYPGQPEMREMVSCISFNSALKAGVKASTI